ncbi:chaperone NapD [Dokdonella koreensis]|uniref:Chaperone NapD n=1 Tax=Dokdonella koreensis DS-123 TaxID=1300342 RepID=A0A160DW79_9GAMM|nr:chaperone NapD [Dokdonella koreensis]ANB18859.1 NapD family protein [Dokdonella koreensis DS-123]
MSHAEAELHIASFMVQHRPDAGAALDRALAGCADLELAIAGATRSVVVCESDDTRAVMDRIEMLRGVAGVLNVVLVYHHAEPRAAMAAPLADPVPAGARR